MNKSELVETLQTERARWDALLSEVRPEEMDLPGVCGEWSVKNLAAHLAAWERRPVAWLEAIRNGTQPQPAPWPQDLTGDDPINAWIFEANRNRPWREVLDESRQVSEQLRASLQYVSEQDLITPARFEWLGESSVLDSIACNSYAHYREHGEMIRAWLDNARRRNEQTATA